MRSAVCRQSASADDWNEHWGAYAESASLNPAQTYRRKLILEHLALADAPRPVRLLELGSGQGDFARELLAVCPDAELVGIDLSATGVEIAREKVPEGRFFAADLTCPLALPAELSGWATHVVCSEVLEHVDDPKALLANVRPLLAPGCKLVITVPGGPVSAFDRHIGHRRHFTPAMLDGVLRAAGLQVSMVRGAGFPFFNVYRLVVLARGEALIKEADGAKLSASARAAMRAFSWLFRWNRSDTQRGWQLVARAVEPGRERTP